MLNNNILHLLYFWFCDEGKSNIISPSNSVLGSTNSWMKCSVSYIVQLFILSKWQSPSHLKESHFHWLKFLLAAAWSTQSMTLYLICGRFSNRMPFIIYSPWEFVSSWSETGGLNHVLGKCINHYTVGPLLY